MRISSAFFVFVFEGTTTEILNSRDGQSEVEQVLLFNVTTIQSGTSNRYYLGE